MTKSALFQTERTRTCDAADLIWLENCIVAILWVKCRGCAVGESEIRSREKLWVASIEISTFGTKKANHDLVGQLDQW
jgi:hypothetical protein